MRGGPGVRAATAARGRGTPSAPPDHSSSDVEPASDGGFQSCSPPLPTRTFTASKPGNWDGSAQMPGNRAQMGPASTAGWCEPAGLGLSPTGAWPSWCPCIWTQATPEARCPVSCLVLCSLRACMIKMTLLWRALLSEGQGFLRRRGEGGWAPRRGSALACRAPGGGCARRETFSGP